MSPAFLRRVARRSLWLGLPALAIVLYEAFTGGPGDRRFMLYLAVALTACGTWYTTHHGLLPWVERRMTYGLTNAEVPAPLVRPIAAAQIAIGGLMVLSGVLIGTVFAGG